MGGEWTRRQVLTRSGAAAAGVAGLGLAAYAGYQWPHGGTAAARARGRAPATPAATHAGPGVRRYVSEPGLAVPELTVTFPSAHFPPGSGSGYIFAAPFGGPGFNGAMICDRRGRPVWLRPNAHGGRQMDVTAQSYQGKPVLTWWDGKVVNGIGYGNAYLADDSYSTIATIRAGHGLQVDLHEFVITARDTALITAVRKRPADLSALGGPSSGMVLSGVAQEIDIATGAVLFEWDSLDHVPVTETRQKFSGGTAHDPFDYFHLNSIAVMPGGGLLISARNTSTVYKVSRPGGSILWRLGGADPSFTMGPGTQFYWQHHARPHGANLLSIFDDGAAPPREPQSRAIFVRLDEGAMRATLERAYTHPAGLRASAMGDVELLPDGRVFVGWGAEPYFSEFAPGGRLIMDGEFPGGGHSYRAFTRPWTGRPTWPPVAAVHKAPAGATVYASWNGATEVDHWRVLAGQTASGLRHAGTQERTGFETVIDVTSPGPYFAVEARDSHRHTLGRSATVRLTSS